MLFRSPKMQFTLSFVAAVAALSQVVSATPLAARADGAIKIIASMRMLCVNPTGERRA